MTAIKDRRKQAGVGGGGQVGDVQIKTDKSCHYDSKLGGYHEHGLPKGLNRDNAHLVYQTMRDAGIGPNDRIMIAGMETILVETAHVDNSGNASDHDSIGVFQQRPSARVWGTREEILNIRHATMAFTNTARQKLHCGSTPGQLAQAVQNSGYGGRYEYRRADAEALIRSFG
jgi:hypothetical protein